MNRRELRVDMEAVRAQVTEHARSRFQVARKTLIEAAIASDPEDLFASLVAMLAFRPAAAESEADVGPVTLQLEMLAYELFPLFGRAKQNGILAPQLLVDSADALEVMTTTRMFGDQMADVELVSEDAWLLAQVRGRARMIRGSAFASQLSERVRTAQGKHDAWFERRLGIRPTRALEIMASITAAMNAAFESRLRPAVFADADRFMQEWERAKSKPKRTRSEYETRMLEVVGSRGLARSFAGYLGLGRNARQFLPVDRTDLTCSPTEEEWAAMLMLFGFTTEYRAGIEEPVLVRHRPLYVFPDGRVVLVDSANAYDEVWARFDQAARADDRFRHRYLKGLHDWVLSQSAEHLRRVFPSDAVFVNLTYPDPDKEPGAETELDFAVSYGPFLILGEAKARQFRITGQLSRPGHLVTDLEQNIEEAFDQALRAQRYVESMARPRFVEQATGQVLEVDKGALKRTYPLVVTLHEMSMLTTKLGELRSLGLFADGAYPFSISEADLDIVTKFCEGPDVFLHYVQKRLETHALEVGISGDELDMFGCYLSGRMVTVPFRTGGALEATDYWLSFSGDIERWMMHEWHGEGEAPEIKLDIPSEISEVLRGLRTDPSGDARWLAFSILDLSSQAMLDLAARVRELKANPPPPGTTRSARGSDEGVAACVMVSNGSPPSELRNKLQQRLEIEKHRQRADRAVGLGYLVLPNGVVSWTLAVYSDSPWQPDPELDKLVERPPPVAPVTMSGRSFPRNSPCVCGSGRKYKLCCMPKVLAASVSYTHLTLPTKRIV